MKRLELEENGGSLEAPLEHNTGHALRVIGLVQVRPARSGSWELVPRSNIVGAVRVGNVDVVVKPKAPFSSVLFMLGYARNPKFPPMELSGGEADLWPALAETLARLADRALGHGVLQGYVSRDETTPVLRGRIRASDQMSRHFGLPFPLEVTFDDYSADIPENQILRSALHRMAAVPGVDANTRGRLLHLNARLDGVTMVVAGVPPPAWVPNRLNSRYHDVLGLSELILRFLGVDASRGAAPVASFVVNMADAFEGFVEAALIEALADVPGRVEGQYIDALEVEGAIAIRPDVVHLRDGRPHAVFDAKYKLASRTGVYPNADYYQMLAYCTALRLSRGYLIYAGSGESIGWNQYRIKNSEIWVVTVSIGVRSRPKRLVQQVGEFGQKTSLAGSAPTLD